MSLTKESSFSTCGELKYGKVEKCEVEGDKRPIMTSRYFPSGECASLKVMFNARIEYLKNRMDVTVENEKVPDE